MTFDERYEQLAQEGRIYGEIEKEKIRLLDVPRSATKSSPHSKASPI